MCDLNIVVVSYSQALREIQKIRRIVFQEEQGVAPELEFDGKDDIAEHFLAYWQGQAVGTARMRQLDESTVKIERLAVLKSARGQGIGRKLMEKVLDRAISQNHGKAVANAQEYVKSLYKKLGFEPVGERFEEAGIPHRKMVKQLSNSTPRSSGEQP
ncbi:GNAT family N-acetyltransferase [Lusitaniella coriacea]|uniref:GNAT family N-acetyltransferase n=1 Tax=Lusitaniella coriacea TaxID=1983105 RepID=UPI003CEAB602